MKYLLPFSCLAAVLAVLLVSAFSIIPESPDTWIFLDIGRLEVALVDFKEKFGVPHVPSRIKLSETCDYPRRDRLDGLDHDSVAFLMRMWPEIDLTPGTKIDWNGDGRGEGDWVLEGDECLVFFLGGIPALAEGLPVCLGFSADPSNPTKPGGTRRGPFFEFSRQRLRDLHGRGFPSYLDCYRSQPYAFFSSYGEPGGYNRYGDTDCPSLKVWPYAEALGPQPRFLNPRSFQIISAGRDRQFGPGTSSPSRTWNPAEADRVPTAGRDDLSNFHHARLGTPSKE